MSTSSNHKNNSFDKINQYVSGDMPSSEKNTFEKEALDNPFLQDAIDGFSENTAALNYFKTNLKRKSNANYYYLGIGLISVLLIGGLIWKFNESTFEKNKFVTIDKQPLTPQNLVLEIIPVELETLQVISKRDEISQYILVKKQKNNPIEPKTLELTDNIKNDTFTQQNFTLEIVELSINEDDDAEDELIQTLTKVKVNYPFTYFYDLAVVDYRRYENREKSITKTTYIYSGIAANYESQSTQNQSEFSEKVVDVSYMDYLKESIWYFSKAKYRNALKQFDIIASQYKNDLNALFYGGLSNYNLGRFEFALTNFISITVLKDSPFYEEALWYKAKTEIKLGHINQAKQDLELVIIDGGFYAEKAIKILKDL